MLGTRFGLEMKALLVDFSQSSLCRSVTLVSKQLSRHAFRTIAGTCCVPRIHGHRQRCLDPLSDAR